MFVLVLQSDDYVSLCGETNIGRIYTLPDTLMSLGRRRWRGQPVLGRTCRLSLLLTTRHTGSKYNMNFMQSNNPFMK